MTGRRFAAILALSVLLVGLLYVAAVTPAVFDAPMLAALVVVAALVVIAR